MSKKHLFVTLFSPKTLLARLCRFVAQEVFGMILQNRISKTLLTLLKKLISVKKTSAGHERFFNKISKVSKVFEILICMQEEEGWRSGRLRHPRRKRGRRNSSGKRARQQGAGGDEAGCRRR